MALCERVVPVPVDGHAEAQPTFSDKDDAMGLMNGIARHLATPALLNALSGPQFWKPTDFEAKESYTQCLDPESIEEVEASLRGFKSTHGEDYDKVSQETFPLPGLALQLSKTAEALQGGRGFAVLRGLDASRYSVEDSVIIYLGIASYMGDDSGLQYKKGNVFSHITNSKLWKVHIEQRHGIHSSQALPFYTDMGCEILALQVREAAQTGGCTYLSSAGTVFNQLLREEPDVAKKMLSADWPIQMWARPTGRRWFSPWTLTLKSSWSKKRCYYIAPVFSVHEGRLLVGFDPSRLGPHPTCTDGDFPPLTAAQRYALDRVSTLAKHFELCLHLEADDLMFLNNWEILHRRDSYQDGQDTFRHMVRMWLRNTKFGWSIPTQMLPPWLAAYGQKSKSKARIYLLHPMKTYVVPMYTTGSAAFVVEDTDESDVELATRSFETDKVHEADGRLSREKGMDENPKQEKNGERNL